MKKYIAEMLGTFGLTIAVLLSISGTLPIPTPLIAALTLGLFVYSIGHISGTHLNPAVSIALWSIKKISPRELLGYIVAQFIGAGLASAVAHAMLKVPMLIVNDRGAVGFAEGLGAFFFAFGIASVVYGKAPSMMSGAVVGGSLLLGISIAASVSNGVLNPAVAYGIGSFSAMYLIGPIIGAILGMRAFAWISGERV